jgi:hypothetical protein
MRRVNAAAEIAIARYRLFLVAFLMKPIALTLATAALFSACCDEGGRWRCVKKRYVHASAASLSFFSARRKGSMMKTSQVTGTMSFASLNFSPPPYPRLTDHEVEGTSRWEINQRI